MKRLLLSYACCLSLAASAATIDSPEVGQFFKLPSWAPAAVDSEHTPGSPDTVVDVYTNVVKTTEWKFGAIRWAQPNSYNMIELVPTNAVQPTYVDGRGWDLSASLSSLARAVPPSEGSDWYSAPGGTVIEAGEGAGSLAVSVRYDFSRLVDGSWLSVHTTFTWTLTAAKQEVEPVNTGRKAVRPIRLVPEMFSSLYATFEAFYERAYYSCCGERNEWDVDIYGPTTDDHLFRFDLPDDPEYGAFWCEFQYTSITNNRPDDPLEREPCTNRTILTRRLVDGENVLRLAESVHGSLYSDQRAFPKIFVERPGWQDLTEYQSTSIPYYLIWSSTVFDSMGLTRDFPALEWRRDPITPTSEEYWSRTYTGWRDLAYVSTSCNFDWSSRGSYYKTIPRMMFERVNFGEPPFDDDWQYGGPMPEEITSPLTNVTEEVLAHPYGDRSLITNAIDVTRRLNLSKIGQLNQALACLDRTYYVPQEFPQFFGTREGAHRYRRYESELYDIYLTGGFDVSDEWKILVAGGEQFVPQPSFVSESTNTWSSNFTSDYAVVYSEPTSSSLVPDNSIVEVYDVISWIPYLYWQYCEVSLGMFIGNIPDVDYQPGTHTFRVVSPNFYYGREDPFDVRSPIKIYLACSVMHEESGTFNDLTVYDWLAPTRVKCRASALYDRSYEYAASSYGLTYTWSPMSYPGDFSRAGECEFTSLMSAACVTGKKEFPVNVSEPWHLGYTSSYGSHNDWMSGYKTSVDQYFNGSDYRLNLGSRAADVAARCRELASGNIGAGWNDPIRMIPMRDGDVARWLGHLKTDVKVLVVGNTHPFSIEWFKMVADSEGNLTFASAGYYDGAGNPVEVDVGEHPEMYTVTGPSLELSLDIGADAEYSTIDVTEYYGFLSNGKQSGCARVDWKCNCLRLNKDE